MEIPMRAKLIAAAAVTAMLAGVAMAGEPPAMQVYEGEFSVDNVYVPCLGEVFTVHEHITARSHQFRTVSGTYHLVDNLRLELTLVGPGGTYFGIGLVPLIRNSRVGQGSVEQTLVRATLKPVDHDGTVLSSQSELKITVNAKGDFVVFRDTGWTDDWFRCVRPEQ
jgi:hypothetical protein